MTDDKLAAAPRGRLLFALAHALDGRGEYARAAECLREGNALTIEINEKRRDYSPADHERFVDGLLQEFDRDLFARLAGAGSPSRRPVFVFGLPRSGTTLIEQVLASHSQVHGAGELRLARRSFEAIPGPPGPHRPPRDCVPFLDQPTGRAPGRAASRALWRRSTAAAVRASSTRCPTTTCISACLSLMFPDAVFVHSRRDLRDVAVSCWMTDFRSIRWANDPKHIASRFQQYHRVMSHWKEVLPARSMR